MAATLEIGVQAAFELHIYNFGGKLYRQRCGGPTGKRLTCPSASIRMIRWWRRVKEILSLLEVLEVQIKIALVFIYVDDFRVGLTPIPYGSSYCPKKCSYSEELKTEVLANNLSPD